MMKSKRTCSLLCVAIVAALVSQTLSSAPTFEDQKCAPPTDPSTGGRTPPISGTPPSGGHATPITPSTPSHTPPSHGGGSHGGSPPSSGGSPPSSGGSPPSSGGSPPCNCGNPPSGGDHHHSTPIPPRHGGGSSTPPHHGGGGSTPSTPTTPTDPGTPYVGGSPPSTGGGCPPTTPTTPTDPGTPYVGGSPPSIGGSPPTIGGSPPYVGGSPPYVGGTPPIIGGSPPSILPPVIPGIIPGVPTAPGFSTPPFPFDPNSPPFNCNYWLNHPTLVWGLFGVFGTTLGGALGSGPLPGLGANANLMEALSNTRSDGVGQLYREGTAALLNSMVDTKFPYSTNQVRNSFVAALGSNKAAAAQAKLFKRANEGKTTRV